ncbi:sensor histidine kinase [Hyalangium rubrum]|uniref:histidine kinase n=1 Tax=Hyalangium rubrum TaxID=3103134 RepID=A0ABU5HF24_9BACT|nr:ATP-binding protein [Hyalangium sp. s54d21]MDY7231403.1 ATP-binding protein [Hyalangium sp. s54d21]
MSQTSRVDSESESAEPTKATPPGNDTSMEQVLQFISRLKADEANVRYPVGQGPLAPVIQALNGLAADIDSRRSSTTDAFGIHALVRQAPSTMIAYDTEHRIRFINSIPPGVSSEEIVGRSAYDWIAPHDVERVRGFFQKVLETGEPVEYETQSTPEVGNAWFSVRLGPVRSGSEIVGLTLITTDVTAQKLAQLRLEESLRRLEQSNRELESFASVASHDLQEPLRKIQSFGERLKSTAAEVLSPEARDYLERMQNAATRMRRLIDDLLAFSRVSSKAQPFVPVNLSNIAGDVVGDLEVAIEQAGATVTVGPLPTLKADPTQMRQLLQNLLSNALKFRQENVPPRVNVQATVDAKQKRCELRVEDNGIGFDEKYLGRIFNLFQRLHGQGKYAGTGIGLAICRKIVERHGGTISASSVPGQGATFIVSLPLEPPQSV